MKTDGTVRVRSVIALCITFPLALLIVVVSGPTPWMGAIFAAIIGVPQLVIWLTHSTKRGRQFRLPGRPSQIVTAADSASVLGCPDNGQLRWTTKDLLPPNRPTFPSQGDE